jgi:Fibronectin type III domain
MTTKVHSIKAIMNFRTMTPDVVFTTANGVITGVYNNPGFAGAPAPPVDQPTLQAANNALAAANSAAANGGKKELEQQKKDKEVVVKILVQLAHWAETNCKDDMTTFLSSGFHAVTTAKTKTPPVSEAIRKIAFGSVSGSVVLTLVKFKGAASYELRWASVAPGTANPTTWSSQPVANSKTPVTVSNLTPGTIYVFQARAVTATGYSDWSQPVTKMVV